MLDAQLAGAAVPNDLQLGWAGQRAAIVTGPNMGGKSCLIRQAALLVIMAQVGCAGCAALLRGCCKPQEWCSDALDLRQQVAVRRSARCLCPVVL